MKNWVTRNVSKILRLQKYMLSSKSKLQFEIPAIYFSKFLFPVAFLDTPKQNSVEGHKRIQVLLSVWLNKQNKWPSFTLAWSSCELTKNRSCPLSETQRNIYPSWVKSSIRRESAETLNAFKVLQSRIELWLKLFETILLAFLSQYSTEYWHTVVLSGVLDR